MDYYKAKRHLIFDLEGLIRQNKGKELSLKNLNFIFMRKYGFGERIVMKALKQYEERGLLLVKGDRVHVYGGKDEKAD